MTVRKNPPKNGEQLQKFALMILSSFMQPGRGEHWRHVAEYMSQAKTCFATLQKVNDQSILFLALATQWFRCEESCKEGLLQS